MISDGKSMGFITDSVKEMKDWRTPPKNERFLILRMEDLFLGLSPPRKRELFNRFFLGQADEINILRLQFFKHLLCHIQLTSSPIQQNQIWKIIFFNALLIPAEYDFVQHAIIDRYFYHFDLEITASF